MLDVYVTPHKIKMALNFSILPVFPTLPPLPCSLCDLPITVPTSICNYLCYLPFLGISTPLPQSLTLYLLSVVIWIIAC